MAIDPANAQQRVLEAIAGGTHGSIEIVPVDSLPGPSYNFEPAGWMLFAVHRTNDPRVGGVEYVAVHGETGAVRILGVLGG